LTPSGARGDIASEEFLLQLAGGALAPDDRDSHADATLYLSLVVLRVKYTGRRHNGFIARA
jgi:hypothetical protein